MSGRSEAAATHIAVNLGALIAITGWNALVLLSLPVNLLIAHLNPRSPTGNASYDAGYQLGQAIGQGLPPLTSLIAFCLGAAGIYGLAQRRPWARTLALAAHTVSLCTCCGVLSAPYAWYSLLRSDVREAFAREE
jgi:hypothetical protein